ncbi:MAG: hypothetical protein V1806_03455 [Pseudomonadota bacterium]
MTQERTRPAIEPGQEVEIGLFRPQDAAGVAALFRAVYGEGYPVKVYYQPDQLIAAVERGDVIQVVARTPRGEVVGVENMFTSAPFKGVYEMGAGLVAQSYRKRGISRDINRHLMEEVIPVKKVPMTFGEPVCNHVYQQKSRHVLGYVPMALEVDLMPAEAYSREQSASGRVAALMSFKGYEPGIHDVYLPPRHARALAEMYADSGLRRGILEADPAASLRGRTVLSSQVFDFAQVARVAVPEIGADLDQRLGQLLAQLQGQGVRVVQVWLPLASPQVAGAAEVLRARGFFLGGVLPRWFDTDGLLMQKVPPRPNWSEIKLDGQRSERIRDLVHQDWHSLVQG